MSNGQLAFFILYLVIQIVLPLRRHFRAYIWRRGKMDIMADYASVFSWTMKMRTIASQTYFIVYNRETGETIYPYRTSDFLLAKQAKYVEGHPRAIIQFAKFLEQILIREGLDDTGTDFGIKVYCAVDMNKRGAEVVIDESLDFRKEKVKCFGSYSWYLKT